MPQRATIPFVGGTNQSRSIAVNNQSTVNLINSLKSRGAKSSVVLESAPGLIVRGTAGNGVCRSPVMVAWDDGTNGIRLYGAFGTKIVAITDTFVVTELGTIETTTGIVRMARGRDYIMFVEGTAGWTWDGTTFAQITDLDFPTEFSPVHSVTHVAYSDGFFKVNDADTDNWYISALEDPTSWNALDFDAAAVSSDKALALVATDAIVYVIGDETMQPYYNDGNKDFPYRNYLAGVTEVGIAAPQSIAESDDGVFYLATTPEGGLFVQRYQVLTGTRVSREEQDETLAQDADPAAAYGFIYQQAGKAFYVLQLAAETLIYNINAGEWENRELANGDPWRVSGHGIIGFTNLVGSRIDNTFYEMSLTEYDDAGEDMIKRRVSQIYHLNGMRMEWWQVVIEFEPGVGLESGTGSNPICRLRYSDDNGQTWSAQLEAPIGKQGEYGVRCVYNNLGDSRNRMLEVEISEAVPITIINAYAVLEVLDD